MRVIPIGGLAMLAALSAAPAIAQAAPASETTTEATEGVSSDALEASYRLLESTGYEKQVKASVIQMGLVGFNEGLRAEAAKNGSEMDDALKEKLQLAFVEQLDLVVDEFTQDSKVEAALIYAKYFTAAELNRLAELHEDPVMRKSVELAPSLTAELMQVGVENMRKYEPAINQRMREVVEDYLANLLTEESS